MKPLVNLFLTYLRVAAKLQLAKQNPLIIGITGSAGKTSTLNAVEAVLQDHFQLKVSHKANSESGIPLNILGIKQTEFGATAWIKTAILVVFKLLFNWEKYEIYLAEMAIDSPFEPKNMSYLLRIITPDIAIFLNAKPMHSLQFDQVITQTSDPRERTSLITQAIAQEKGKMIQALAEDGIAILNFDDPNVQPFAKQTRADVIGFGQTKAAQIKIEKISQALTGTKFILRVGEGVLELEFDSYLLPSHFAHTLAAAAAVASNLGLSLEQIKQSLEENFRLPPGRSSLIEGINSSLILDSSYNASAQPTIDALDLMNKVAPGRKLALLGDIRELGQEAKPEHQKVAAVAKKVCDQVYLVGPQMKKYVLPYLKRNGVEVGWFESAHQAAQALKSKLKPNDLLLVKGSQNTLMLEIAVEELMAKPQLAKSLLCRRGNYWDQRRSKLID